jgi:hypothetical protein
VECSRGLQRRATVATELASSPQGRPSSNTSISGSTASSESGISTSLFKVEAVIHRQNFPIEPSGDWCLQTALDETAQHEDFRRPLKPICSGLRVSMAAEMNAPAFDTSSFCCMRAAGCSISSSAKRANAFGKNSCDKIRLLLRGTTIFKSLSFIFSSTTCSGIRCDLKPAGSLDSASPWAVHAISRLMNFDPHSSARCASSSSS